MIMFNKLKKKQEEEKKKEDQEKIDTFMREYKELCEKHEIMFVLSPLVQQKIIMTPVKREDIGRVLKI